MEYICEIYFARYANWVYPGWHIAMRNMNRPILDKVEDIKANDVIYCTTNSVPEVARIVKDIKVPFVLITGLSDNLMPYQHDTMDEPKNYESCIILENPYLLGWFGINKMLEHPKMYHIPIGIPRCTVYFGEEQKNAPEHFMAFYSDLYGYEKIHDYLNSFKAEEILGRMRNKETTKENLLYARYTTHNSSKSLIGRNYRFRYILDEHLQKVGFEKLGLCSYEEHVESVQKYRFVLCPPGRCLDGFLLWECMILGVIPVTFASEICDLYRDLPVLVLKNMSFLTPENLEEKYKEIIGRSDYNFGKLKMQYWIDQIEALKKGAVLLNEKDENKKIIGVITKKYIFADDENLLKTLQKQGMDKEFICTLTSNIKNYL